MSILNKFDEEEAEKEISKFKTKRWNVKSKQEWNLDLYFSAAITAIKEIIASENDSDSIKNELESFQLGKLNILISNFLPPREYLPINVKIIIFDEDKFKSIIYDPHLFLFKKSISFIRDWKSNWLKKIYRIDRLMKEKYDIIKRANIEIAEENERYKNKNIKYIIERRQNSLISVPIWYALDLLQSWVLAGLTLNYKLFDFKWKFIGIKDGSYTYKLSIKLDDLYQEEIVTFSKKSSLIYIFWVFLQYLKSQTINNNLIIDGLYVLETALATENKILVVNAENIKYKEEEDTNPEVAIPEINRKITYFSLKIERNKNLIIKTLSWHFYNII